MSAQNRTFVRSSYAAPCRSCGEGVLAWDADAETSRCRTCGVVPP